MKYKTVTEWAKEAGKNPRSARRKAREIGLDQATIGRGLTALEWSAISLDMRTGQTCFLIGPESEEAVEVLEAAGVVPVLPGLLTIGMEEPDAEKARICALCQSSMAYAVDGWMENPQSRLEVQVAESVGIKIAYEGE